MHNEKYLLTSDQSLVGTKRFDVPGKPKIEWFWFLAVKFWSLQICVSVSLLRLQ